MVAGSVTNVSVRCRPPSSSMSTSRPASRRRRAVTAPPAPLPTTRTSAAKVWFPDSSDPTVTFGYSRRCSGGTSRSAGAFIEELGTLPGEGLGAPRPVDVQHRQDARVLIEGEEDERAEPHHERFADATGVLEGP